MPDKHKGVFIGAYVSAELKAELQAIAQGNDKTVSFVISKILRQRLRIKKFGESPKPLVIKK